MVGTRKCYGCIAISKSSFLWVGLPKNGRRRNDLELERRRKPPSEFMAHKVGGRKQPPFD